ncbi:hypothetical protein, conserved [Eimeria acervulina]|uniref:Transmembrane protein n=1 Tax=Eimeria acervulina TaxID=5801 RepID=U6GSC9_EIMAC|nr:hypothetical protein, conserved [Eimeria acervulina]CDI83146.1 hypothetical protein, conserved [Eimeria acervulina]
MHRFYDWAFRWPVACLRGGLYSQLKGHWKNRPEDFWKRHCQLALRSRPVQGRAPDRCWGVAGNTPRHLSSLSEGAAGAAHRLSGPQEGAPLPNGGPIWTTEGRSHLALRLRRVPKEDWVLVFISLGWSCAFAGAVAFKAWRSATRESRHPYLQEAKSMLQSDAAVVELLGTPLDVKAVEEHSETFAPWKRLVLQLRGPRDCTHAFVCARRVGYSEDDLIEKFAAEEEGALWSRPYVLKQWLLQAVGDAWELFQLLLSSRGTEGRGRPEGVGQWEVTSLFLLAPQDTGKDDADTQIRPTRVIACKGSPEDNPDWSTVQHHRHLQQLTARQLQDAAKKRGPIPENVSSRDKRAGAPQVRLRYFTGQLSREAIDGVAHLEIHTQENAGHDPDFADMLQCELEHFVLDSGTS